MTNGTRSGWEVSVTSRPLFTPGKDPVPIVQEAGWAPGPVWTGAENLAPTRMRCLDCPVRSQSLYRLRYPAHIYHISMPKSLFNFWISVVYCGHSNHMSVEMLHVSLKSSGEWKLHVYKYVQNIKIFKLGYIIIILSQSTTALSQLVSLWWIIATRKEYLFIDHLFDILIGGQHWR